MTKKQIIAVIIALLLILFTGISGVTGAIFINKINKEVETNQKELFDKLFDFSTDIKLPENEYIGQLNIVGTIQQSASNNPYLNITNSGYDHDYFLDYIDLMIEDTNNKGLFLYVDSPGGTVYHSVEMYEKLLEYKESTERPIYAYFASQAASGAYLISMAADYIYANKNTWTGSIGVIISFYNYKGLLDKIGVSEINIVSGSNKAMGSGGEEMTEEQAEIMQSLVDEAYEDFTSIVSKGRNIPLVQVKTLADGRIYTAKQALNVKLIDEISTEDKAIESIKNNIGTTQMFIPKKSDNIMSLLYGVNKLKTKESDSDIRAAMDMMENTKNGVLMYYAK